MLSKVELEALIKILPSLSHYQILKVGVTASAEEIQNAFHREAQHFHPDRYQGLEEGELLASAKQIYAKLVEAYRVLTNKSQRDAYDMKLTGKSNEDFPEVFEDEVTTVTFKKTTASASGLKFYKLAQTALQSGSFSSAKMNIQLALNTDPQNREFQSLAQRIEAGMKKK